MTSTVKLAGFALGLAVVFGAGYGAGAAAGPLDAGQEQQSKVQTTEHDMSGEESR